MPLGLILLLLLLVVVVLVVLGGGVVVVVVVVLLERQIHRMTEEDLPWIDSLPKLLMVGTEPI